MKTKSFAGKIGIGLLAVLTGLLTLAAPKARADEDRDPPTRVARVSFIDGSVSLQPGGEGDWGTAAMNRPVTIGDKIWVDKDSRAELQAGQAAIHLGSMTALSFLNLDENITQMRVAEGSINFRVRELREGDLYEVDTPNMAFTVKQAGAFRIDVAEDGGSARVTVIRGEGEVTAGGKTYEVHPGERAEFRGTENVENNIEKTPGPDGLDRWAESRDLKEDNSVSGNYVSRDTPGYSDLDDYGDWRDEPEYGHVWYPREVAVDWAPYSYGYWSYVGPWGWTWVDYAPWGFAPFHYGRWAFVGGRWGWCPGPIFGPPVYGPAFVGFFGGGFGFGVGWFPLGFGEPFYPWFHCRHEFIERINVRNTFIRNRNVFNTNVHNFNFVNAHNVRAVTVANRNTFVNGQAINRGAMHVTEASLRGAQVTNSVGLKPTSHSGLGAANVNSHVAKPSASVQSRAVVARTSPAQGATHSPVRTFNNANLTVGRAGNSPMNNAANHPATNGANPHAGVSNSPAAMGHQNHMPNNAGASARDRELSQNRPPSAAANSTRTPNNGTRTWEAQGNTTDRGRAPAGFGSGNRPANTPAQTARATDGNRPPWARSSPTGSAPSYNNTRPNTPNGGRSYNAPQRSYTPPARSYNPPSRSYTPPSQSYGSAPSRSYSPPSRSYSPPSHSYSPPSHSSGGYGGGTYHGGGGGGGSHTGGGGGGGGGSSHGGGGGGGSSSHGGGGGGSSHGGHH